MSQPTTTSQTISQVVAKESQLLQTKLTGDEWNGVEIMEPENEMRILNLIIKGFHDVNYKFNTHLSLASRLKVTPTPEMVDHLYNEYFKKRVEKLISENPRGSPYSRISASKSVLNYPSLILFRDV